MLKPEHGTEQVDFRSDPTKSSIVIHKHCHVCDGYTEVTVNESSYRDWNLGSFAQDVWPQLSADQREMIISGTHEDCWNYLFPPEEGEV